MPISRGSAANWHPDRGALRSAGAIAPQLRAPAPEPVHGAAIELGAGALTQVRVAGLDDANCPPAVDAREAREVAASAFGALLRQHRFAAGLSQEALAERARMSVDAISALERGTRRWPQRESVALLAGALGLAADELRAFESAALRPRLPQNRARGGFVPSVSVSEEPACLTNLPLAVRALVGRDANIAEIVALLEQVRLVTITGAGGIGKTSSAIEVGSRLVEGHAAGVWFIEFAPVRDSSLVAATIARTLDVRETPGRSLLDTVLAYLRQKELLLILDNCEHVIAETAIAANALLRACPNVRILVTSRETLRIPGEHAYSLPSLEIPHAGAARRLTADAAQRHGSVALFVERAQAADRRFRLSDDNAPAVAEICRRLDGIPLAIELAAARVPMLSVNVLSEKLDRRFDILTGGDRTTLPRHQTMRALIDWSYDLLDDRERAVFTRLSVFAGGWSLDAAVDVCCESDVERHEVFDVLASLVAKSLVIADVSDDGSRYRLFESTLDYARERLAESERAGTLARRHARYFVRYLREKEAIWEAMDDLGWQRAVLAEIDNVRAALDWALRGGSDPQFGVELLTLIKVPALIFDLNETRLWYGLGYACLSAIADERVATVFRCRFALTMLRLHAPIAEQLALCEANVAAARAVGDPVLLADALGNLGAVYWRYQRLDEADAIFAQASSLLPTKHAALASRIIVDWANNDLERGDIASARTRFLQARRVARPGSQLHAIASMGLAEAEFSAGNVTDARDLGLDAVAKFRILGMETLCGAVCINLAAYAMERGSLAEAHGSLAEALAIFRELGVRYWLTLVIEKYAVLAALTGNDDHAAALLGYVAHEDELHERVGQTSEQRAHDRAVSLLTSRLGEAEFSRRLSLGSRLTEDEALTLATSMRSPLV